VTNQQRLSVYERPMIVNPVAVDAMWPTLQQSEPDDYVIATGEMYSVPELCRDMPTARAALVCEASIRFPELVRIMLEPDLVGAVLGDAVAAPLEGR
jgi:GDP-D-mannose dehydratase